MSAPQTFERARPLAQHCPELTARGVRPGERAQYLAAWRRDVAREVAVEMADLLSGSRLEAQLSDVETLDGDAVFDRVGAVAANCLLRCGPSDLTALLSFEIETAIALTDRSFGGSGEKVSEPASALPRSAALLIDQAARRIAQAIARVSFGSAADCSDLGDVILRSENASRLKPFTAFTKCAFFTLELKTSDGVGWEASLALPVERLDALLPGLNSLQADQTGDRAKRAANCGVMNGIPLSLEAVLAEFDLSLSALHRLAPGDEIPLKMPREAALRLGAKRIALGNLGTSDNRIALRLTSLCETLSAGGPVSSQPLYQGASE